MKKDTIKKKYYTIITKEDKKSLKTSTTKLFDYNVIIRTTHMPYNPHQLVNRDNLNWMVGPIVVCYISVSHTHPLVLNPY